MFIDLLNMLWFLTFTVDSFFYPDSIFALMGTDFISFSSTDGYGSNDTALFPFSICCFVWIKSPHFEFIWFPLYFRSIICSSGLRTAWLRKAMLSWLWLLFERELLLLPFMEYDDIVDAMWTVFFFAVSIRSLTVMFYFIWLWLESVSISIFMMVYGWNKLLETFISSFLSLELPLPPSYCRFFCKMSGLSALSKSSLNYFRSSFMAGLLAWCALPESSDL